MKPIAQISHELQQTGCQYALFYHHHGEDPIFLVNNDLFHSASIIKLPILLAWAALEKDGLLDRREACNLDAEPQVQGAGFSWLMASRSLPYHDVLLMMIAMSDNLCTNLIVRRIGLERLATVFRERLGLRETRLERKLMDYAARAEGKDNWISAGECVRLFDLFHGLEAGQHAWIEPMLAVQQDAALLMRDVQRDTLTFYHKTGSVEGVLHDWGYTDQVDAFLFTQNVADEVAVAHLFGDFGRHLVK